MRTPRRPIARIATLLAMLAPGIGLWVLHARAWGLGTLSPVLNYDSAQYALAGQELAERGRLATPFALPIELARHSQPPWPLAVVQPGLVVAEAAMFRLIPAPRSTGGDTFLLHLEAQRSLERWTILLPLVCYLALGVAFALIVMRLLATLAPEVDRGRRWLAAATIGLAFLLDPEAQHFAVGGFTELPFTLGLALACGALLLEGGASRRPMLFGLLLGLTGSFRASALWLAPVLALAAAALAPGRRVRTFALAMIGFALPLSPWWFYKWRAFGNPGWDLSSLILWEGVQGRTWFSIFHLPEPPSLPTGLQAAGLIAAKIAGRLPGLLLAVASGPRVLWAGALILWLVVCRPPRPLAVTALAILVMNAIAAVAAAATIPWLRFLFPTRVLLEAAGVLALWGLLARPPASLMGPSLARALSVAVGALAVGWGVHETLLGNQEALATSRARGVPGAEVLRAIAQELHEQVPVSEPVMSNLGPTLAWYAARPILHLAQAPADLEACRRRLEFRHVVLVFRRSESAWPEWQELFARPEEAPKRPEWNVAHERHEQWGDFQMVWLELGPREPNLAAAGNPEPADNHLHPRGERSAWE